MSRWLIPYNLQFKGQHNGDVSVKIKCANVCPALEIRRKIVYNICVEKCRFQKRKFHKLLFSSLEKQNICITKVKHT